MWTLWTKAKTYSKLPSEIGDPRQRWDDLTRYMFDSAVTYFGVAIENALAETVETTIRDGKNSRTSSKPKYTLSQLLDPAFRLPNPQAVAKPAQGDGLAWMMALARQPNSGVKAWAYVDPAAKEV